MQLLEPNPPLVDRTSEEGRKHPRYSTIEQIARAAWGALPKQENRFTLSAAFQYFPGSDLGGVQVMIGAIRVFCSLPTRWTESMATYAQEQLLLRIAAVLKIEEGLK